MNAAAAEPPVHVTGEAPQEGRTLLGRMVLLEEPEARDQAYPSGQEQSDATRSCPERGMREALRHPSFRLPPSEPCLSMQRPSPLRSPSLRIFRGCLAKASVACGPVWGREDVWKQVQPRRRPTTPPFRNSPPLRQRVRGQRAVKVPMSLDRASPAYMGPVRPLGTGTKRSKTRHRHGIGWRIAVAYSRMWGRQAPVTGPGQ